MATHPSKHDIITLGAHVAKANRIRAARKRSLAHPQLSKHSKQIAERGRKEAEKRALAARQVLLQAEIRRRAEGAKSRPVGKFPKEDRGSEIGSALKNIMSQLISFTNVSHDCFCFVATELNIYRATVVIGAQVQAVVVVVVAQAVEEEEEAVGLVK